jgi:hypothetical protein
LRRGIAESPDHVLLVETQEFSCRSSGAEHPACRGDMPTAAVMRRGDGVSDAALGLDTEDHRVHQILTTDRAQF